MGMNWRYVHKEKVDKPNSNSIMGGHIVQGKNQSNFPLPNFTPTFTFRSLGWGKIHNLTKYYDVAMVWDLGYASIWDYT